MNKLFRDFRICVTLPCLGVLNDLPLLRNRDTIVTFSSDNTFSDFDGDDYLNQDDLSKIIRCLTRDELSDDEIGFITARVCLVNSIQVIL